MVRINEMVPSLKSCCIAVFASSIFLSTASIANEDWFVGTWEFDREATYSQFESMEPGPEEIIACYEDGGCGAGDRTLYTKTEQARLLDTDRDGVFTEVGKGRAEVSIESTRRDGDEFIVTLARSWTDKKLIQHFTGPDQYYTVINFKGFTWRYYQKRVPQ